MAPVGKELVANGANYFSFRGKGAREIKNSIAWMVFLLCRKMKGRVRIFNEFR